MTDEQQLSYEQARTELAGVVERLEAGGSSLEESQLIASARRRLDRAVLTLVDRERHRIEAWRSRPSLARPELLVDQRATEVTALRDRAVRSLEHRLRRADDDLRHTVARLRALSPRSTLQRGYAIVQRADGHVVRAADEVKVDDQLRVRLAEGELRVTVGEQE